ncbi:up-regulator of cell proliferation-like [Synchiropus picturatus]
MASANEDEDLKKILSKLGLERYYPNKLNICDLLEVNGPPIVEKRTSKFTDYFLTRLVEINAECRNCSSLMENQKNYMFERDGGEEHFSADDDVHPLDLIVALFLCADSCLQQEMALKMSMCQFSLPLLLPPTENSQCTLMLWALRGIIKEWQPHGLSESRGFKENYIVQEGIPLISFVRLKNCSLSKSQILNQVLSRGQQSHNMFMHREMEGGEVERKISAGLVEVGWFLPSGRENLDVFSNPVAFANLRGDISESQTQFTFLMEVSTAVFVFLDRVEEAENQTLRSFKEELNRKDAARVAELDRKLVDSSLGLEHYMREMGLIFEFSSPLQNLEKLPGLAADLLLDGYPLELLDGEASNIPQRWISHVLMELHQKVGGRSRLLVLTVLGVQSSGKSTLLNTMFGVRFPVSSGRCTRGAYMLFLKVGEDMQCGFDFILLIDTEGLKSPELAQLDDSYEHDNQLATFVIGLSDITIINIAMENATEMKLVLQIFIHASLRMKEIHKKPICHFVHQNVAGVSSHGKNTAGRNRLLDHLNEMTQLAAEMEQKPSVQAFTDVLDYNVDTNNWYIPGLWHGTPPMAPVSTGYSEAVADFKNKLLESVKHNQDRELSTIPEFIEWITSLWRAVKHDDIMSSLRDILVAQAYDDLFKEFSQWEKEFRTTIISRQETAELEIQNADHDSDLSALEQVKPLSDRERDDCQRKAEYFVTFCIKPAVEDYINRSLGINIVDEVLTSSHSAVFSSRSFFQYSILKELLLQDDFKALVKYCGEYESLHGIPINMVSNQRPEQ